MTSEIGMKIGHVTTSADIVRPYGSAFYQHVPCTDLNIFDDSGTNVLYVCGENDWGYFALDILKPILKEANTLYGKIRDDIEKSRPEAILVGKNEFRILDILHIARDGEEGISVIDSVPIVPGNFDSGVKFLGKDESERSVF
jgi:hypothetical protein